MFRERERQMLWPKGLIFLILLSITASTFGACSVADNLPSTANPAAKLTPPVIEAQKEEPGGYFIDSNQLPTSRLARSSKWIVLAKSISSEVRETPDKNIFTFSDFEVLESVKGVYPESQFTLRVVGGEFGGVRVTRPFETEFEKNQKYVLFLGKKNSRGYPTINPQGIFTVRTDEKTNIEYIVPVPSLPLYNAQTEKLYSKRIAHIPLEDFLYSLRKIQQ